MVSKYGAGETKTQKCKSCSYEQVIYSSGAHVSESGSVRVYGDEDTFHCPNCDKHDSLDGQNGFEDDDPFGVPDPLQMQNSTIKGNKTVGLPYSKKYFLTKFFSLNVPKICMRVFYQSYLESYLESYLFSLSVHACYHTVCLFLAYR